MNIGINDYLVAFGITLFAGLATGIGSILAFYTKQTNKKFLSLTLGFSAGVMIYVSMVEIFQKAKVSLGEVYGFKKGYWVTVISFFCGIAIIALIDKFVPNKENPHSMRDVNDINEEHDSKALMRMGLFSALAIAIHNFPEGIATFMSGIQDTKMGLSIAVAVAIHNIPEGIAVSVPVYFATGSKKKAFIYSFLSGLSEPVGALVGFFLISRFMSASMFGILFAAVAGIMIYISLDELLPTAQKYGYHHISIYGLIAGMAVMALSLLLFS